VNRGAGAASRPRGPAQNVLRDLAFRAWGTPFRYVLIGAAVLLYLVVMAIVGLGTSGGIDWF
jgi:hypothetical protein